MMSTKVKNFLITGLPGSGKTTLVQKLGKELLELGPAGFFTEEIRERGVRKGFKLTSLDKNGTGVLAHVDIRGPIRVGKYGVDVQGFEGFLKNLRLAGSSARPVVIDEVGRMECLSETFRGLVRTLLNSRGPVIATIALKADSFIEGIKGRPDVLLVEITEQNREALVRDIAERVRALMKSGGSAEPGQSGATETGQASHAEHAEDAEVNQKRMRLWREETDFSTIPGSGLRMVREGA